MQWDLIGAIAIAACGVIGTALKIHRDAIRELRRGLDEVVLSSERHNADNARRSKKVQKLLRLLRVENEEDLATLRDTLLLCHPDAHKKPPAKRRTKKRKRTPRS